MVMQLHEVYFKGNCHGLFLLPLSHWRGHQTSPTVVSLKGRLPQKLQSKYTLS